MSLTSSQSAQWGEAGTHGTVDGSRNRAATAAAVAGAHARHAVGVVDYVEAVNAAIRDDGVANGRAAGYAGEVTVAQLVIGNVLIDAAGWIGIDGGRVGILATGTAEVNRLDITSQHNDAIALCLSGEAE